MVESVMHAIRSLPPEELALQAVFRHHHETVEERVLLALPTFFLEKVVCAQADAQTVAVIHPATQCGPR